MLAFLLLIALSLAMALSNFAEGVITSLSVARLKGLKTLAGSPSWQAALRWIYHPEEYLTLILLTSNIVDAFYAWALVAVVGLFVNDEMARQTVAYMIGIPVALFLLNIMPKLWARKLSGGKLALWCLNILHALLVPFYPFFRFFFICTAKILGSKPLQTGAMGKSFALSFEEIGELLKVSNVESSQSYPMMAKYLKLEEVTIEKIMTPRSHVSSIGLKHLESSPDPGRGQAAGSSGDREKAIFNLMTDGHSRTIVTEGELPVGYVHAKDLFRQVLGKSPDRMTADISRKQIRPIPAVHADQSAGSAIAMFLKESPIAYVVDQGKWVGIVTLEDILEEITGEILDEFETRKKKR